jgi:hypothetical protein
MRKLNLPQHYSRRLGISSRECQRRVHNPPHKHIQRRLGLIIRHHVSSFVDLNIRNVSGGKLALAASGLDEPGGLVCLARERDERRLLGGLEVGLEGRRKRFEPLEVALPCNILVGWEVCLKGDLQ